MEFAKGFKMSATWLDGDLRMIRAGNPSPLTGAGTNTYLLGQGAVVVIDPGPVLHDHLETILSALGPQEKVAAILVTHCHRDHSALARALSDRTGAQTYAFGPAHSGRSTVMQNLAEGGLASGGEGFDEHFTPDNRLNDGDILEIGPLRIEALSTPGHTGCHMCFAQGGRLFSGDHVMAWATSLISPPDGDMAAYMTSLAKLAARTWSIACPGHGDPIFDPAKRLSELTHHRLARQDAVLAALQDGPQSPADLTRRIYTDLAPDLLPAAERNVLAHLIKLWQEDLVLAIPAPLPQAMFAAKL